MDTRVLLGAACFGLCATLTAAPSVAAEQETETKAELSQFGTAKLSLHDAISAAELKIGGQAINASFQTRDGASTYRVNVYSGDTVTLGGYAFASSVFGGLGDDDLNASGLSVPVSLYGGVNDDSLTGGSAADYLDGGEGYDFLSGGLGNDLVEGGSGGDAGATSLTPAGRPGSRSLRGPADTRAARPLAPQPAVRPRR